MQSKPAFLLKLSTNPPGFEAVIDVGLLRSVLEGIGPGTNMIGFFQALPVDAAQSLVLWLLSLPGVAGLLAPDLIQSYIQQEALRQTPAGKAARAN